MLMLFAWGTLVKLVAAGGEEQGMRNGAILAHLSPQMENAQIVRLMTDPAANAAVHDEPAAEKGSSCGNGAGTWYVDRYDVS
jgi:hypothetical protein